jgi:hypothetical protein
VSAADAVGDLGDGEVAGADLLGEVVVAEAVQALVQHGLDVSLV